MGIHPPWVMPSRLQPSRLASGRRGPPPGAGADAMDLNLNRTIRSIQWSDEAKRLARWLNPAVSSAAAPLESIVALEALGPSLMPRTSKLQGMAVGFSVLSARATTSAAER